MARRIGRQGGGAASEGLVPFLREPEMLPSAVCGPAIPHRLNLYLAVNDTEVQFVDQPAVAALLLEPASWDRNPFLVGDLIVVAALGHARALFHVRNSAASGRSGKQRIFLVSLPAGSMMAVIDAPNFWLP